jgi:C-terminal processing protease CtpA/Prc
MRELNIEMGYERTVLWILTFINTLIFIKTTYAQPVYYTEKIYSIPDLTQTDKRTNFPGSGRQYCSLVAISNSLMWFDSNGFPNLVQNSGDLFTDQVKLVKLLASESYMNTSLEYGTGTTKLIRGVRKYIKERGYEISRLEYQGWRKHPKEIPWGSSIPKLDWIKQGIIGNGTVWMNVGWYKYNAGEDEYARIAGHWVTLVGYGRDEKGQVNPNILIIHDPSPRAGKEFSNEFILVSRIRRGKLTGDWVGLPRSAAGYYKFTEGMHIKRGADFAILDGAVVLKLKGPARTNGTKRSMPLDESKPNVQRSKRKLQQARAALRGQNKDIPLAQELLLDLAENHTSDLTPTDRCYLYVYLGYIEDLAGNRQAAIGWYKQALPLEGAKIKGIRAVAEHGMTGPITRIRHLDGESQITKPQPAEKTSREKNIIQRIGKGFVTHDKPPGGLPPKMYLSKAERIENFDILWEAIDKNYSFFEHKKIDWQEVKARYRPKVEAIGTTEEFYRLLYRFIRELKDFHSWLDNYKQGLTLPKFSPQVSTRLIEGEAVIIEVDKNSEAYKKGIYRGSIILEVDGLSVEEKVKKLRPLIRMYSSQQAFVENAYRQLLDGEKGSKVKLKFLPQGGKLPKTAVLTRVQSKSQQSNEPNFRVNKGKFIWYGTHPSGLGYICILSFKGRMEIADEFDHALDRLKDTPGLIIDIRENPGGFGTAQARIIGRFITQRTKVNIAYIKSGAGRKDFKKHETYFVPMGDWQYTKPIALLMNAITGSACDLFACRMISTGRAVTIGTTTHGNLTGRCVYIVLPCNLVVRVSNGYICDASGRIIEGKGNVPQIHTGPTIDDIVSGTDPVLKRAVQTLRQMR